MRKRFRTSLILYPILLLCLCFLASCGNETKTPPSSSHVETRAVPTPSPTPTPTATATPTPTPKPRPTPGVPLRLQIPTIGIDAPVEEVGLSSNGEMGTPTQNLLGGVGWYRLGPRPGQQGSAVIDGHLGLDGGAPGVFRPLSKLHAGDTVQVIDQQNRTWTFRVQRTGAYSPNKAPVQEIFGRTDGTFLNLITCAGDWDFSANQMSQRLVVYTILED